MGSLVGVGLGRPNAPPNGVGCPPEGVPELNGAVEEVEVVGVGRDAEWEGLLGPRADLR